MKDGGGKNNFFASTKVIDFITEKILCTKILLI